MAYILHIDTSADTGIVALSHDGNILSIITNADTRNHAATINLHIEKVLNDAGITMQLLDAVCVCGGPGSYTGLRIGLATAKGLCYILDKPLMMHSRLLLLLLEHFYKNSTTYEVYNAILIAREKEFYFASYNNKLEPLAEPHHIHEEQLQEMLSQCNTKCLLAGDITERVFDSFSRNGTQIIAGNSIEVNNWAHYAFDEYNRHSFVNLAHSEPFYLKQVFTHKSKNIN